MRGYHLVPNTFCFNSLIDAWRDAKRPEVHPRDLPPRYLLAAYTRCFRLPQDAEAVLAKMSGQGIPIDGSSYNRVIRAWGDTKHPQRAENCLEKMAASGLAPDQFCYNSVINAWADAKNPERAELVLRKVCMHACHGGPGWVGDG